MSVERNLQNVLSRREKLLAGDAGKATKQREGGRFTAHERIEKLLDEGSFVELDVFVGGAQSSGVITGYGLVDSRPVYVYAQDFTINSGAMGAKAARKIAKILDLARTTGAPVVSMHDSFGADLTEGADALNGYAEVIAKTAALSGVVPQIALVLGHCQGAAAAIPSISDFVIMPVKGASLTAGAGQVIAATAGKANDANALGGGAVSEKSGCAHIVAKDETEVIAKTRALLSYLPSNNLEDAPGTGSSDDQARALPAYNAIDTVKDASALIKDISDDGVIIELQSAFGAPAKVAFGRVNEQSVGFVAMDAGALLTADACAKIARFVRTCDCFGIPVVTLCDAAGMTIPAINAQGALIKASGQLLYSYAEATVGKVSIIVGKAIGAAYIALAGKGQNDVTYAWPGSVVSPLDVPAAVQALYEGEIAKAKDAFAERAALEVKYADTIADALTAAANGYVDDVIEPMQTRKAVARALEMLLSKRDSRPSKKHGNLPL